MPVDGTDGGDRTLAWALSSSRLAVLWVSVAVGVVVLAAEGWHFAVRGVDHVYLLIVAAAVVYGIVTLLRGVVAVVVEPLEGSVVLFRAAGPALRTRLERVLRIDHGRRGLVRELSYGERVLPRVVTRDGTARFSLLFPRPVRTAEAIGALCPRVEVDL